MLGSNYVEACGDGCKRGFEFVAGVSDELLLLFSIGLIAFLDMSTTRMKTRVRLKTEMTMDRSRSDFAIWSSLLALRKMMTVASSESAFRKR